MTDEALKLAIAQRVTWLSARLGVSLRAMSARAGVSHSFAAVVAKAESLPSVRMLVGLRREFGVSLHWLLLGEGEPFVGAASPPAPVATEAPARWIELGPIQQAKVEGFIAAMLELSDDRNRAQAG